MKELRLNINHSKHHCSDQPALIWADGSFNYADYLHKIYQIAEILSFYEIREGNRVAIFSDTDYRFPILFFAILHLKAIAVPLNTKIPLDQINLQIEQANCQYLITFDSSFFPSGNPDIPILSINEIFCQRSAFASAETEFRLSLGQEATILFTSGSSGKAKAIIHSIGNHYYSALGSNTNILLEPGDRWLISLPFYHVAGIAILFRTMLAGGTSVIGQKNQPIDTQLQNKDITHLSLVPTQLHRLIESTLDSVVKKKLKAVLIGGSSSSDLLINRALQERLPIYLSYGSTEMSSQITATRPCDNLAVNISSGSLLPYRELKIDQDNEILVRGKTLASGYWELNEIKSIIDKDGWFHTGDLGYLDKENQLVLNGRKDNMFISAGVNIHPEQVENVLLRMDDILEACVVAITDDEYGTRPVAFLKMKENSRIDEEIIKEFLKKLISKIMIPIRFIDWPPDEQLKVDRKKLQIFAQKMAGSM